MTPNDRLPYGGSVVDDLVMPGKFLGRYQIDRWLHLTLLGALYQGRDERQGEDVCLHVLPRFFSADELFPVRLQQLIRRIQQSAVKGVLRPSHIEHIEGHIVIVYEGVNGESATDYVLQAEGPIPEVQVFSILDKTAAILEEAGSKGLGHWALAPENVLIGAKGDVTLVGLGLLETLDREQLDQFISTAIIPIREKSARTYFTLMEVMSPEVRSRSVVDIRAEIYSLGVLATFLLSGKKGQPPASALQETDLALYRKWSFWLDRCLHEVPAKRYATLAALRRHLGMLRTTGQIKTEVRESPVKRVAVYCVVVAAAALAIGYFGWRWATQPLAPPGPGVPSTVVEVPSHATVDPGELQTTPLSGNEQEAISVQSLASVEITSVPQGIPIFVNGEVQGVTPARLEDLPVSVPLTIFLQNEQLRSREVILELEPGVGAALDFVELMQRRAVLELRLVLQHAELLAERLDLLTLTVGERTFSGISSYRAVVAPGDHSIEVNHPDFIPIHKKVSLEDDEVALLELTLEPLPAVLQLNLPPDLNVLILLNGTRVPASERVFSLSPGVRSEVTVQPENHAAVVYSIVPRPNQQLQWTVPFLLLPGPEKAAPWSVPGLGLAMVWIPAGEFLMGSPMQEVMRLPNEGPQTRVTIASPFWMASHEVTQAQFTRIMQQNPSRFRGPQLPVDSVTWAEAMLFAEKLTAREREAGRLPEGFIYRLPTEAEWEFAARAGSSTPFSFGSQGHAGLANVQGSYPPQRTGSATIAAGVTQTLEVGSFAANDWGLFDMHGNVREWVLDHFADRLPGGHLTSPLRRSSLNQPRVVRGGSWAELAHRSRSAARDKLSPESRDSAQGFRIVLAPER